MQKLYAKYPSSRCAFRKKSAHINTHEKKSEREKKNRTANKEVMTKTKDTEYNNNE